MIFSSLSEAITYKPYFAIIASPASHHIDHAVPLLQKLVPVLIEKPLSNLLTKIQAYKTFLLSKMDIIDIAYNLRYLPSAVLIKQALQEQLIGKIYSVSIDVGQYLADWRPNIDYRKSVSAQSRLGGGALLELSHDLDYLVWLFGEVENVFCNAENTGAFDIDVEDNVSAILKMKNGILVNLHMDFLQRIPCRTCKMVGELGTLVWDVLNNEIIIDKAEEKRILYASAEYDRNLMYCEQLLAFQQMVAHSSKPRVGFIHSLYILSLITALKESAATQRNISLERYIL